MERVLALLVFHSISFNPRIQGDSPLPHISKWKTTGNTKLPKSQKSDWSLKYVSKNPLSPGDFPEVS